MTSPDESGQSPDPIEIPEIKNIEMLAEQQHAKLVGAELVRAAILGPSHFQLVMAKYMGDGTDPERTRQGFETVLHGLCGFGYTTVSELAAMTDVSTLDFLTMLINALETER